MQLSARGAPCARASASRSRAPRLVARSVRSPTPADVAPGTSRLPTPSYVDGPDPDTVVYATFRWPIQLDGEDVQVAGSWDDWASQARLLSPAHNADGGSGGNGASAHPRSADAMRTLLVPRGVHDYKFIVDGKWRPAPGDPVARDQAGATNNKRLFTCSGAVTFKGRRDMEEVLVIGSWSNWTDAQRMLWSEQRQQWECPLALQPGEYSYLLNMRGEYKLNAGADAGRASVLGRERDVSRLAVGAPAPAFALFYATGWPRCSLVYRVVPVPGQAPGEWREVALDGAPSRAAPGGGRWMQAMVEAPGPDAALHFYVRGPQADVNDEWGRGSSGGGGGGGGGAGGGGGWRPSGSVDAGGGGGPVPEDRPSASSGGHGGGEGAGPGHANGNGNGNGAPNGSGGGIGGGPYYTLPWPGGWKLERGAVSKFLRALQGPIMLCSDVDGTFVSDKGDPWGDSRIADFRGYWEDVAALGGSVLVLNTGRSRGHLMDLLAAKAEIIAVPDVLITAVGTKIWHRRSTHRAFGGCSLDDYEEDALWTARLDHNWDLAAVKGVAQRVMDRLNQGGDTRATWLDKGSEHPHRIALSVHVAAVRGAVAELDDALGRASDGRCGAKGHVIASGAGEWRYLDVVAERGGKLEAIEWVRALYGLPAPRCMTAGDSFNDVEMFKGACPAVIVGNAQRELVAWYDAFREEPPGRILLARAPDALGVMEGLARHGLL